MPTQGNQASFQFHPRARRQGRGQFDGGTIPRDAGGLRRGEGEKRSGIRAQFTGGFRDPRDPARLAHPLEELGARRGYGLALGYEDLNDHEELRRDPLRAVRAEKPDPPGGSRRRERAQGQALAGKRRVPRLALPGAHTLHPGLDNLNIHGPKSLTD